MAQLFYTPQISQHRILPEQEAKHCLKILRHRIGDIITLIDGKGSFFRASILSENIRACQLAILEQYPQHKRSYYLHIAIAPTKNIDRMEWLVEKCTEIGIDEISFIVCKRSERKEVRLDRLEKIAIQALKQSQKAQLPKINACENFDRFLAQDFSFYSQQWVAHVGEGERRNLIEILEKNKNYCILIGPEGDLDASEIQKSVQKGFQPVSLGNSILRTETAGIVACSFVAFKNECP